MNNQLDHRGFMLDVSRHFMPVEHIKRLIEGAALCGMNRMHWHLTDDQGWRIEIQRYPQLTEIGSRRGWSWFGSASGTENNCGFYTQSDVRSIVAFAKDHNIEIIPEIEIPGHASALLAAMPECGCRRFGLRNPYHYTVMTSAGIFPNLVCAGRDDTLHVIQNILDEVIALFPFPAIHIGGDETPKLHWRRCPDCQQRMESLGIATEDELQRWMMLQIGEYLAKKGRRTVVWSDVLAGGMLPKHFIVQQWLNDASMVSDFMKAGGQVICSDTRYYYFDYVYGATDVHAIWNHSMIPEYAQGHEQNFLGVECPLWTEYITNIDRAAFMLFPRLTAVGLRAGGDDSPDWDSFVARVKRVQAEIDALGLVGAPEPLWHMSTEAAAADREAFCASVRAQGALRYIELEEQLMLVEKTERLMENIHMPREFMLEVGDAAFGEYPSDDGRVELARQLAIALHNREDGPWTGLPENVWIDTMSAFSRFVNEHRRSTGRWGFDRGFWTTRQINAKLFRLGELEYELLGGDGAPFEIALHIPSDVHLITPAIKYPQ